MGKHVIRSKLQCSGIAWVRRRYSVPITTEQTAAQHLPCHTSSYHASNLPIAIFNCTCDWKVLQRYRRCTSSVGGINAPVQISKVQERQESGKNLMNTVLGEGKRKKTPENGITLVFITISVPAQGWRGSVCNAGYTYVGIPVRPNLCVSVR